MNPLMWFDALKAHPKVGIVVSRGVVEIACVAVMMGTGYALDHGLECKPIKRILGNVLSPAIGALDWAADNLPALESEEETHARRAKNVEDRAYGYADVLFDVTAKNVVSMAVQTKMMEYCDTKLDIMMPDAAKNPYIRAAAWDHGVQIGSAVVVNTVWGKQNEQVQDALQSVMEKCGVPKDDANIMARDGICMVLPNIAGALASIASLYASYGAGKA